MAISFVTASSEEYHKTTASISSTTITLACFVKLGSLGTRQNLVSLASTSDTHGMRMRIDGGASPDSVACFIQGSGSAFFETSATIADSNWHHAAVVTYSANSHAAFLDGGNKVTDADNYTAHTAFGELNLAHINVVGGGGRQEYGTAEIAEVAVYTVALADAEIAMLARGVSPLMVRPSGLAYYAPLIRSVQDRMDSGAFTVGGTPDVTTHPPVTYPHSRSIPSPSVAAAAYTPRMSLLGVG